MSNVRIALDRQRRWPVEWTLTAKGEQYVGPRPMPTAELAAKRRKRIGVLSTCRATSQSRGRRSTRPRDLI